LVQDRPGWFRKDQDGSGKTRMVLDISGWFRIDQVGSG